MQDIRVKRENEEVQTSLEDLLLALKTGSASRKEQLRIYDFLGAIMPFVGACVRLPYALGQIGWFISGGPVEQTTEEVEPIADEYTETRTIINSEEVLVVTEDNV